mmetsp:Transcript_64943/g.153506  ORF Transcript_64943/g.153506 Transcript_64943/m.153506 type:complete len:376 (-) Transcript_64943:218-1345(-)
MVTVPRRMYCFHESLPDSRPPPVCLLPPNAPPISAPEQEVLTLMMPVSDPAGPIHLKTLFALRVKSALDKPWSTELFLAMPSSRSLIFITYMIGTNSSSWTTAVLWSISMMAGSTKLPGRSGTLPPTSSLPPSSCARATPPLYASTASGLWRGPRRVLESSGSPIGTVRYAATRSLTNWSYTPSCTYRRRSVVHRCPAVPTAANNTVRFAMSRSASSRTTMALFPPSSKMERPKRAATVAATLPPTCVDPVKDTRSMFLSSTSAWPTSLPPHTSVATAPGCPLRSRTSAMIFCVATAKRLDVGAVFQTWVFPQIMDTLAFHPNTAFGKLKAVMMPTLPSGFHVSSSTCSGRSEGITWPGIWREIPAARSHMSIVS